MKHKRCLRTSLSETHVTTDVQVTSHQSSNDVALVFFGTRIMIDALERGDDREPEGCVEDIREDRGELVGAVPHLIEADTPPGPAAFLQLLPE